MPAPATVNELLDLVQKSGVADEARLKTYMQKLTEQQAVPAEPGKLAGQLVRDGLLTYFQAEQLLQGKWKRFSIGKYKVLERLGAGGMGQVFLCEHKLMKRRVAVKVLPTNKASDASSLGRFYREARAVAAVDHPNIVRAYDIDQDENLHFLVMEYVDGTNLNDLVKKSGPLDPVRAAHYIYGSAVGLQHAHEMGLVHRDIKPGNILVDRAGVVKILDLGLARFFHDEVDNLTKQYDENVLGTADYLSPEQALDSHTVDIRADIYSLGATFYFLLTGSAPFPEGSVAQKLIWHQSREPKPVKALRPEVPDELVAVVTRMMAKKPEDRFQTPAELMAALAPWVSSPIPPPADREMPQLSLAASGSPASMVAGRTGPAGPPPRPIASPVSLSEAPTIAGTPNSTRTGGSRTPFPQPVALESTPTPVAAGEPPAPAATGPTGNELWESLSTDTPAEAPADTAAPSGKSSKSGRSGRRVQPAAEPAGAAAPAGKGGLLYLWIGLGALVLVGGGVAGYFIFANKGETKPTNGKTPEQTQTPPTPPPEKGGRRLVVTKTDPDLQNLTAALRRVQSGDTLVLTDPQYTEPPYLKDRAPPRVPANVTIESGLPDGKPAVVTRLPGEDAFRAVFMVADVSNLRVRNVVFDGLGEADSGVVVGGNAPGVTFENVTVRGVKQTGFNLRVVAGKPGSPLVLDSVRAQLLPTTEGVLITDGGRDSRADSLRVTVRNAVIWGPGKTGIRFDGRLSEIEAMGNRIFNVETGFAFTGQLPGTGDLPGKSAQVTVGGNTVVQAKVGVLFDNPTPSPGRFDVTIVNNYFGKTAAAGHWPGQGDTIPGVKAPTNRLGPDSQPGNLKLGAGPGAPAVLSTNPDDPNFLKVP